MYKRIAVAVDGSKTSDAALSEAIKLSGEMKSTLLLLHVCEELPIMSGPNDLMSVQIPEIIKVIEDAGAALLKKNKEQVASHGIAVETKLVESVGGRLGSIISEEAQKWNADLLVVGTHGRKGFEHLMMGSVAEGAIRTASTPVLLIRGKD